MTSAVSNGIAVAADGSSKTLQLENTSKRDTLVESEKKYQKLWQEAKMFETNAPTLEEDSTTDPDELRRRHPKYFGTMAYPYMNGTLHAGHAFTLSKVEFKVGYERMRGKRALFPLGFHCTGMPIKACADKLVREVEMFGKDFASMPSTEVIPDGPAANDEKSDDVTKIKSKKGKAATKAVQVKYQAQIMLMLGVPLSEVHKFADAYYWLEYFPPLCKEHCNMMGARIDWRRSFLTTDANPYYDAFTRWQMNRLKEMKKIKFGERYTIFSPKDDQPCMDHDRSVGEAVGPQEYTGIKIQAVEWSSKAAAVVNAAEALSDKKVFFLAATLRPETMYGQTCCFVGPKIEYGFYASNIPGELFVCTHRAARNLAYQGLSPGRGVISQLASIKGIDLIGTKVSAPLSVYQELRVLPMDTVLASKGTGVVTCVPSDSPDDYATIMELRKKASFYGIQKEWVDLEIVPILNTPTYGDITAEALYKSLKIQSPKDTIKLTEAKELAYREGYYQGTMLIGKYKGMRVEEAKTKVRDDLISAKDAVAYVEPERLVVSRSADECVVALCDQWYLDYGEEAWLSKAHQSLDRMATYQVEVRKAFEGSLAWLNQWACSRSYGLGTRLPWDPQYLVESLSDSTIYMAYYTIAHFLHKSIDGKEIGPAKIKPEEMTDEVWDYVFTRGEMPESTISKEWLKKLRREFEYFYPLDVRISGKDLIPNHLTFFIYIHVAMFPPNYWPNSIRVNGHLLLNGEKMSKSTGNFMTLEEAVRKFGADAARIALADAGDSMEDANFEESTANSSILRLFTLREWCSEVLKEPLRTGEFNFFDKAFENEMNTLISATSEAYEATLYKNALKTGLYDILISRDWYRQAMNEMGLHMHKDLVMRYIEVQALMLTPIAPHWSEYTWKEVLHHSSSVQNATFPEPSKPVDPGLSKALDYVRGLLTSIRQREQQLMGKKVKKGMTASFDPRKEKEMFVYVSLTFPAWQEEILNVVRECFDGMRINDADMVPKIHKMGYGKKGIPFAKSISALVTSSSNLEEVLNRRLLFDEVDILQCSSTYLCASTGYQSMTVISLDESRTKGSRADTGEAVEIPPDAESSQPGSPSVVLRNVT